MSGFSPMMQQYLKIKKKYESCIVFFRLGDFYEMFYEDAKTASKELDITLTGKECGQEEKAPMCGVPYHAYTNYVSKLISKGYKVAICEQIENPLACKGLVKREVTRVITPGTIIEGNLLDESKNNFICCVYILNDKCGMCFADISTGELKITETFGSNLFSEVKNELARFSPSEVIYRGDKKYSGSIKKFVKNRLNSSFGGVLVESYDYKKKLLKYFNNQDLENLNNTVSLETLGGLFSYLEYTQKDNLKGFSKIDFYTKNQYMKLDLNTIRNLELVETMRNREKRGTLLWVLDKTNTAMGRRLLRNWIERPLIDLIKINNRQEAVSELVSDMFLRDNLIEGLSKINDVGRILTRLICNSINCREIKSLGYSISNFKSIKNLLSESNSHILKDIYENIDLFEDICKLIENSIVDEPPVAIKEGGIIKFGFNKEIDGLKYDMNNSKEIITKMENDERKKTGIPKLKITFNRVFGYCIEVTNSFLNLVPENYIRKQTLSNSERFVTKELKDLEYRISNAKEKLISLEFEVFEKVRAEIYNYHKKIEKTVNIIAVLDVLVSLAVVAHKEHYTKPEVNLSDKIILKNSKHPVIEKMLKDDSCPFVPNDINLDNNLNNINIITGPNMAGKSTYMRQIALNILMAHIGSFVPADCAEIGIVDGIFTRIGASDDLSSGQSTFMVEMQEVAQIMKNATQKSLLILDEIGRGTSTFDGISIARAVLEYISFELKSKTLFSTHYHELTKISEDIKNIKNYSIAIKKNNDDIIFLRKIIPGSIDESFGIETAKLAKVPSWIINRAKEISKNMKKV
ncbi:MAG: DNA mismatch repair protein MutS [Candidatus Paraimprobicoccus trichonymphae]|uniref:DNA mismatch repair protein MutS n=1 Tax=Candidatus Paraimprobicoccus trichonymphae TaxID=3033793 RepID=A0AA48HWU9_9FIRM|nr:MAG: DNA mismatch repair protein MutS [Candidatus Paraimprobicoccus trichonymphae]